LLFYQHLLIQGKKKGKFRLIVCATVTLASLHPFLPSEHSEAQHKIVTFNELDKNIFRLPSARSFSSSSSHSCLSFPIYHISSFLRSFVFIFNERKLIASNFFAPLSALPSLSINILKLKTKIIREENSALNYREILSINMMNCYCSKLN
jgi:hypothetical protein